MIPAGEQAEEFQLEVSILKSVEEDGESILCAIEDDDEYNEISEIFIDRLEELYEFENEQES